MAIPPQITATIRQASYRLRLLSAGADSAGEEGQGMVEYALILVLIAVVVIVILTVVGNQVSNVFSNVSGGLGT
jgi:pilus assembly protein Flp/PilA